MYWHLIFLCQNLTDSRFKNMFFLLVPILNEESDLKHHYFLPHRLMNQKKKPFFIIALVDGCYFRTYLYFCTIMMSSSPDTSYNLEEWSRYTKNRGPFLKSVVTVVTSGKHFQLMWFVHHSYHLIQIQALSSAFTCAHVSLLQIII